MTVKGAYKRAELSWENVSEASGYKIYRANSKEGVYKIIKTVNELNYTDKGLKKGKTYYYKICAYITEKDKTIIGDYSNVVSIKTSNQHKITFQTNGGSKIKKKYITNKKELSTPKKPVKKGYIFKGWYTNEKLTKVYHFNSKITKDIVLYAKWKTKWNKSPNVEPKIGQKCVMLIWAKADANYEVSRTFRGKEAVFTFINKTKHSRIFLNTGLSSGQIYYYKVRAYKTINGKKVYGKYSKTIKVVPQ